MCFPSSKPETRQTLSNSKLLGCKFRKTFSEWLQIFPHLKSITPKILLSVTVRSKLSTQVIRWYLNVSSLNPLSLLKAITVQFYYFSKSSALLTQQLRSQEGHNRRTELKQAWSLESCMQYLQLPGKARNRYFSFSLTAKRQLFKFWSATFTKHLKENTY